MFPSEISNLPGQIEAALQFLRFTEEIRNTRSNDGPSGSGWEPICINRVASFQSFR